MAITFEPNSQQSYLFPQLLSLLHGSPCGTTDEHFWVRKRMRLMLFAELGSKPTVRSLTRGPSARLRLLLRSLKRTHLVNAWKPPSSERRAFSVIARSPHPSNIACQLFHDFVTAVKTSPLGGFPLSFCT